MKTTMWKQGEVVWKTNRKEDKACGKKDETKVNKEDGENDDEKIKEEFWNRFLKQSEKKKEYYERNHMVSNY